jgi:hypothetical protein
MKIFLVLAFVAPLAGGAAWADDASGKAAITKSENTQSTWRVMSPSEDANNADHGMSGSHGYGTMQEYSVDVMMESDMRTLGALALSKEQKSAINSLSDEFKHKIWFIQGLINDEAAKLSYLYEAERRDPVAIGKEYMKVFDLKRQLIESYLDTQNRIEDVLTLEQRVELKNSHRAMHRGHPLK